MAHVVHGAKATTSAQDERYTKEPSREPKRRALLLILPPDINKLAFVFSSLELRCHRTAMR